jgi:hypothetical protein
MAALYFDPISSAILPAPSDVDSNKAAAAAVASAKEADAASSRL